MVDADRVSEVQIHRRALLADWAEQLLQRLRERYPSSVPPPRPGDDAESIDVEPDEPPPCSSERQSQRSIR